MLRLLDAPAVFAARGWPRAVRGRVELDLHDEFRPDSGCAALTVEHGHAELKPGGAGTVGLTLGGLAVLHAGAVLYAGAPTPRPSAAPGCSPAPTRTPTRSSPPRPPAPTPGLLDYL